MDIFTEGPSPNDNGLFTISDDGVTLDPNKNYLEELVGDGKKFKSVEDLAKGKAEADAFIRKLLQEKEEIRQDLNTRVTLEEFMTKMNNNGTNTAPNPAGTTQNVDQNAGTQSLDLETIEKRVLEKLKLEQEQAKKSQNLATATELATKAFGPDASKVIADRARVLGVSTDSLKNMAAESPEAFMALLGAPNKAASKSNDLFTPPPNRTSTIGSGDEVERTDSYYKKLKRENPRLYWDPKIQVQMHRDATRLKDRFFD